MLRTPCGPATTGWRRRAASAVLRPSRGRSSAIGVGGVTATPGWRVYSACCGGWTQACSNYSRIPFGRRWHRPRHLLVRRLLARVGKAAKSDIGL